MEEKNVENLNELLPYRVYKDYQTDGLGIEPIHKLQGAFATKELAENFINAQFMIDRRSVYMIREIRTN